MSEDTPHSIPKEIPAMTLRETVLFPKAMMPLRIFEERYKQMLSDVLSDHRMFAIVGERENVSEQEAIHEPPFSMATVGLIRVSKKNDDNTSFVLLQGIERVRIRKIVREEPYRLLQIEPFHTLIEEYKPALRSELLEQMERNKELGGDVSEDILEYLRPLDDDVAFVDLAAFTICKHMIRKQALLEVQRLGQRARMLLDDLKKENHKLELYKNMLGEQQDDGSLWN
jgi:Lon protease-like protein